MRRVLLVVDDYGELVYLQTLLKKLGFDVDGIQNQRSFEDSVLSLNPDVVIATAKGKRVNGIEMVENLKRNRGVPKVLLLVPSQIIDRIKVASLANVDASIESPVKANELLMVLGQLTDIDAPQLIDKYQKLKTNLGQPIDDSLQIIKASKTSEDKSVPTSTPPAPLVDEKVVQPHDLGGEKNQGDGTWTLKEAEDLKRAAESNPPVFPQIPNDRLGLEERRKRFAQFIEQAEADAEAVKQKYLPKDKVREFHRDIRRTEKSDENSKLEDERKDFVKALFKKK